MEKLTEDECGNAVSEVTLKSLNELIERKQEETRCKRALMKATILLFICLAASSVYLYAAKTELFTRFSMAGLLAAFSDPFLLMFAIALLASFIRFQQLTKRYLEADGEYEDLRCEIIDRSEELWSESERWENRALVFELLEREHDINLYHKS